MKVFFIFLGLFTSFLAIADTTTAKGDQVYYSLNLINHGMTGNLFKEIKDINSGTGQALVYQKQVFANEIKETLVWEKLSDFITISEIEFILNNCANEFNGSLENYTVMGEGTFHACHMKNLGKLAQFLARPELAKATDAWIGQVPITAIFEIHYVTEYGPLIMKAQAFHFSKRME